MNYGGSQIVCSGIRIRTGSPTLLFGGATLKGYDEDSLSIAEFLVAYFYYDGQLFDPYLVQYSIYDITGTAIIYQTGQLATRFTIGQYYANYNWPLPQILTNLKMGTYKIVWEAKMSYTSQLFSKATEFSVFKDRREACLAPHVMSGSDPGNRTCGTCNSPIYTVFSLACLNTSGACNTPC
ncbi:MAG: hypothetical protein Q7R33_05270 [Nitrosarchaeum sp.]|nr:hypothetical protein [Nitrosarchaeum sp.]